MKSVYYYKTIIGEIAIVGDEEYIYEVSFFKKDYPIYETTMIKKCYQQINEYLLKERKEFDIPLYIEGTPFQKRVWNALMKIPYGEVRSYQEIAIMINNEKATRAVGNANNKNKIAIIIPCHRVIGKNGKLTGYAGGLDIKEKLLKIEEN